MPGFWLLLSALVAIPIFGMSGRQVSSAWGETVQKITFGSFQFTAAGELEISRTIIVGAQAAGGAIGNLIAIHNVVAALATVGLVG